MKLPNHGKMSCLTCFDNCNVRRINNWKIKNDPGHWGSSDPKYLVLGFSKGATQQNIYESGKFEDIAFGGKQCRLNLTKILQSVGLLLLNETVDQKIIETEMDFAFASLIRCSVSMESNGKYSTSGSLVTKSFKDIPEIISNCANQYLANLPNRLSIVIMLGINEKYVEECKNLIKSIGKTEFKEINDIAYSMNNILFVHLTHPSPGNGHIKNWLNGKENIGKKKILAENSINAIIKKS